VLPILLAGDRGSASPLVAGVRRGGAGGAVGALALLPASASAFFDMTVSTSATTPGDFSGGVFTPTVSGRDLNVGDLTAALAGGPVHDHHRHGQRRRHRLRHDHGIGASFRPAPSTS